MNTSEWVSIGALVIAVLAVFLLTRLAHQRKISLRGFELKFPGGAMRTQELIVEQDREKV